MLSDRDILAAISERRLIVEPLCRGNVQPASIDLRLGWEFAEPGSKPFVPPVSRFHVWPGQFILATTLETVGLSADLSAWVAGKSSIGRAGLQIENAGHIDPGFHGQVTLELVNLSRQPITLVPNQPICQLVLFQLSSPAARPYGHPDLGSHYQHQAGVTGARP